MPVYYYPSGQYPTSTTQQYRPIASVQYNAQRSQQIPQTAQQAGIYVCYSFLQLLTVPLLVKPIDCVLILSLNSRGESWSLFCLKTEWKSQIDEPFACWYGTMEEQRLCSPALLSCVQCCVLSVDASHDGAQRKPGGNWCGQPHCMFKATLALCPSSCKLPKHF